MSLLENIHNRIYLDRYKKRNDRPSCYAKLKRTFKILLVLTVLIVLFSTQVQGILNQLKAPHLPQVQTIDSKGKYLEQYWPDQNWGGTTAQVSADTQKYHHLSQGTATIPMPYDWFLALEEPDDSLISTLFKALFFIDSDSFSADDYLLRFGFIRGKRDPELNPNGLPIGFTKTDSLNIPGMNTRADGIGFTCAACHTNHLIAGEGKHRKEYIIEGGPATTDLGLFTNALTAALGQTGLSSKLPFFDSRFDRFAKKVLGTQYNATSKAELETELGVLIANAGKLADVIKVQEGFGRLDALNRIGNQVFSKDVDRKENYQAIDAPVNYPFIWTSSWFKWVQYDGSIMGPLIRNVGESVGVSSYVNMAVPTGEGKMQSSVPMLNMVWIEEILKGDSFNQGLQAPVWPFENIDKKGPSYTLGKQLYSERCAGCHFPEVAKLEEHYEKLFKEPKNENSQKKDPFFNYITYFEKTENKHMQEFSTNERVLDVKIIKQNEIGTDPAQGNILATRLLNTAGTDQGTVNDYTSGLGINGVVCSPDQNQAIHNTLNHNNKYTDLDLINGINIKDGGDISFAFALGAFVDQTINAWFDANFVTDEKLKNRMFGGRPNCLQAGQGYKARPLNGVWATAPFLHNGSVATVKDLICKPAEDRPKHIQLGNIEFDTDSLGLVQPKNFDKIAKKYLKKGEVYTDDGYFILDTSISGNSNLGHSFSDEYDPSKGYNQKKGVIGSKFTKDECSAILDYIKTI